MGELLKKKENESLLEYRARLYRNKIAYGFNNNKDIYDYYIKETGDEIAESSCRCSATNYNQCLEDQLNRQINEFNKNIMIINDVHAPFEREDLLLEIQKHAHEIDTLVIGGDFMDCESISSFPKINRTSLTEELIYSYNLMRSIRKILNNGQKIVLFNGNHEERLKMMISKMHEKDLQKFINPNILEMLVDGFTIYEDGKKKKYEGIEGIIYVPRWYVNIDDKIIVSHPKDFSAVDGKMCEKVSEYFLNQHEVFEMLVFAHTHKYSQMKVSRRQGVYVVENGCMCKNHEYASNGKLGYTPQDYCYTIVRYNNDEKINYNNINVIHLDELEEKKELYKVCL